MAIPPFANAPVPLIATGQVVYGGATQQLTSDVNGQYSATTGFFTSNGYTATNDYVAANALAGDNGYANTPKTWNDCDAVGSGVRVKLLENQIVDGTTTTSTSEVALYSSTVTIPANSITAGRLISFKYWGILSSAVAAPGAITIRMKLGTAIVS